MLPSSTTTTTTTTTTANTITTIFLCCFSPPHFCCLLLPPLPMILVRELKETATATAAATRTVKEQLVFVSRTTTLQVHQRFCTFLCRRCTCTKWKCLISLLVENEKQRNKQRPSFFFPDLRYSPSEFNSRKISQHLINWTRWSKRDKVWISATSLFTYRFRNRRRRIIETLDPTTATAAKTSLKKWIRVLSIFIAIIPRH